MALTAQNSVSRSLYTGLVKAKVLAINPTLQELNDVLHIPAQEEPKYLKVEKLENGTESRKVRLEVHFETLDSRLTSPARARLSLFTEYAYADGMMTNNFGRFLNVANADAAKKAEFEKSAWQKPVYKGEMDVMMLLEQLLNPMKGTEFFMDRRDYLFHAGDTTELAQWLAEANSRKNYVQIMLGVQTDKQGRTYQTTHKKVLASWVNKYDKFHESLVRQMQYQTDTDFGPIGISYTPDSYQVREWFEGAEQAQSESQPIGTVNPYAPAAPPSSPAAPAAPAVGGPLAAAAQIATGKPRFGGKGQVIKWSPNDYTSGNNDPMSDDYNPELGNDLPF